ncbi:zinc finger-containing ubiquitin peptidase 1-like [Pectinophora gossypiella]|uniref:zinc finger-containing ubiquitin peptidase 1-like n=1 Tax=Pectinophora gossypiella TaxID=13191 RepID=UPI00214E9F64|nr:zinc finger-containing ubiquitin peptidase 1-like [Pectinophora gossypiella]
MSSSPFPYTCELCGAEGLTDEGMRTHTLEAHVQGRPECPFCDCTVPQPQLVGHVQRAHLHYLTPERELMAFIDDQSPSFDEDSKMTTTDSCSYNTPGSINGWHSPDAVSFQNGAISKNYHNGFQDKDSCSSRSDKEYRNERDDDRYSRSPKNINLCNGVKNINISNGVIPKKSQSRQNSNEDVVNGHERKGIHSSPSHNSGSYEGSPNKNKLTMASAGQGSPLRSQLALKLKPNTPKKSARTPSPTVQCLLCDFTSTCPRKLEEHINRAHFDLTSPSVLGNANANSNANENPTVGLTNPTLTLDNPTNPTLEFSAMAMSPGAHCSSFQCPLCEREFSTGTDVEMHVNVEHRDILSPQKSDQMDNASCDTDIVMMEESPVSNCPVCCQPLPLSQHELIQHIEEHFERGEDGGAASALSAEEREAMKSREEHEFQLLRAQYGMEEDDVEGYTNRATNSLKRAVYSGALSVAGYYERSVGLRRASASGRDTGCSRTCGILERISQLNAQNPSIVKTYLCSAVDHYASTYGDRGWGCGYRNMQMVVSSLMKHPPYMNLLGSVVEKSGDCCAPSIPRLQLLVEQAWQLGFDTQGSEQLGCKLHNTRKWIGACEVVTVLSSLRIRCQLIDFHKPTGAEGGHPALFEWVLRYFTEDPTGFKPPLYLQHQGHSRTIIGYEKHKDGKATLLVLDPSHSPAQVRQVVVGGPAAGAAALRLLRRGGAALRARQYQLLAVAGVMAGDHEYESSKVLQSIRIP